MNDKSPLIIDRVSPSSSLLERVLAAIYQRQERNRLWRVRVFAGSAVLSVAALIPVISNLIISFQTSNFSTYVSLLFSDGSTVLSYWKIIGASLVESLPAISIAATLALIGILLWSVQKMVRFMHTNNLRTA